MTDSSKTARASRTQSVAPLQSLIGGRILILREQRVMLDADLAELYGVQTKVLVQAVKRNLARFPQKFMFQLSVEGFAALRSQTVTSNTGRGGRRTAPYAFTEQGVAMLSSVLGSPRAIGVNIEIPRTFVRLRELTATRIELSLSTITAGLINVGLLIVLISFIGLIGAAIAFATSVAVKFLLTCYVAQLRHPMPWFDSRSSV